VVAGDALLAPSVTRRLVAEFARRPPRPSARTIARSLYLSENTVKTHVTHVLDKLDLRDRVQAVIYAYEHAVVEPGHR
jgi:Bacterial regulatory proteins, luxR family